MPLSGRHNHLPVLHTLLVAIISVMLVLGQVSSTAAQRLPLVRDAEIEGLIKDYTSPIFKAAGLGNSAIDVHLVNNPSFNAFVTTRRMFIHTGALMRSETPNEIIGVIAHETGHVIGGHLIKLRDRIERASVLAAVGLLLGAGAMAVGGDLGHAAGQAIIRGGQNTLMRSFLAYKREDETSADRAAVTLLNKTGQSGAGMLKTFKRMGDNDLFRTSRANPYIQSHPLPRERIALLQTVIQKSPHFNKKDAPALQLRHDMMRAKIAAYTGGLGSVQRLFKHDRSGAPARYGTAITQFLRGRSKPALKIINRLIKEHPRNPYLYEMKAEILLRARQPGKGIKPMQTALKLDPYGSGLLRILYGHLLLETDKPANIREAIKQIKRGLAKDPKTVAGYDYLARAHSKLGQESLALAATAEGRFLMGRYKDAKHFAVRAQQNLKKNSPQWVRLQDIILYKPKKKKR